MTQELSIYIHIPFCVKKCDYCDFLSAPATIQVQEQYLHALEEEIRRQGEKFCRHEEEFHRQGEEFCRQGEEFHRQGTESYRHEDPVFDRRVSTVFIGGGTPSVLPASWIQRLMNILSEAFSIQKDAEISIEVNPGTIQSAETFFRYREAGINRISIGLQSARDEELRLLGRIHTYEQFEQTWNWAEEAGFKNRNIDLMASLPGQTIEQYRESLNVVCEKAPEHISAYSLIIEEGTPFYARYRKLADEEEYQERDRQMYALTREVLEKAGYFRYEISNYARPGKECKHNLVYWNRGDYLGLGIGAASFIDNTRYKNTSSLKEYIRLQGNVPYEEVQNLSVREQMEEFMFLGLRKIAGVREQDFKKQFGCTLDSVYGDVLAKNERDGLLEKRDGRVFLTDKGLDLSNYVFVQFL